MKSLWIILFLLAPGTQGFLIENAKAKLCLQASTADENLLLEDCDPTSDVQHWSWQDKFLINQGTGECLSTGEANRVQTSPCGSAAHMKWECANFRLRLMGSTRLYLTTEKNKVSLTHTKSPSSRWQVSRRQSICDERPAKAERSSYVAMARTSSHIPDEAVDYTTPGIDAFQEQLQGLLWFFRREDPSTWNYCILALSFVVLFLGLLLLGINIMGNRRRKIILVYKEAAEVTKLTESEAKPPFLQLEEVGNLAPVTQGLLSKEQRPGEVQVQWKDGNVTTLYADKCEDVV
uniref:Ricin B lectin domain-containing protein n=1 Tax=Pelusios castaneus TaxID=367368 RepID=A0A8C8VQG5_9SAUR